MSVRPLLPLLALLNSALCSTIFRGPVAAAATLSTSECLNTAMLSIRKVPAGKLGVSEPHPGMFGNPANEPANPKWTNPNWLKSRFHFSFAEYYNPANQNFGVLRVMNDDLVQPNRGFGAHPHRDVEICTYIVNGSLTHKDSMGTQETLGRGAIQFMSAGRGVTHSEHNLDKESPLRFIQIWINTRKHGIKPEYGSFLGDAAARHNRWAHLVSDVQGSASTPIKIHQDANIHVAELDAGVSASLDIGKGRQAYLLCMEGTCTLSGAGQADVALDMHDAAEVTGPATFSVAAGGKGAHCLVVEMAFSGGGRTDL